MKMEIVVITNVSDQNLICTFLYTLQVIKWVLESSFPESEVSTLSYLILLALKINGFYLADTAVIINVKISI